MKSYIVHVLLSLLNIDADDNMARNTPCIASCWNGNFKILCSVWSEGMILGNKLQLISRRSHAMRWQCGDGGQSYNSSSKGNQDSMEGNGRTGIKKQQTVHYTEVA
ncbi:hypothetical protein POM88_039604 [Heracleum sosnowskyi]|uniref:Secreted protein n=1 Tax=Heracleum sosnowskyi TaxID=360622 RepID=A0AAD8HCJ2_9APIA|nr:hypothetical protein POM88_039604 [Heracleum sosnowskyi]